MHLSSSSPQLTCSQDDLDLLDIKPSNSDSSDARIHYQDWRKGKSHGADLEHITPMTTGAVSVSSNKDILSSSPPLSVLLSADQLPRIPERSNNNNNVVATALPAPRIVLSSSADKLNTRAMQSDCQMRILSDAFRATSTSTTKPITHQKLSGSFENPNALTTSEVLTSGMKKSVSSQGLKDLEKTGYFPSMPAQSASGVQKGLKNSVMNDMCCAIVRHMVGDLYVVSSGSSPSSSKKVINHLYHPVLQSVQNHFKQLPARYALSVNPDDVQMHMRLLSMQERHPDEIGLSAHFIKDDEGCESADVCEVVVVCKDQDNLLDSITHALRSMKGTVMDADVMTSKSGVTLDRFVVKGGADITNSKNLDILKHKIQGNLARLRRSNPDNSSGNDTSEDSALFSKKATPKPPPPNAASPHPTPQKIDSNWLVKLSEVKLEAPVGSGRSGHTYRAWWRGTHVAAKVMNLAAYTENSNSNVSDELLTDFHREVAVVSRLRHPNIVLFLGAAIQPPTYCLLFEFMAQGTLTERIRLTNKNNPINFFNIAKDVAMGMNYLHLCSIIHRDLKSGNVLLDAHGTVKVSDFGLSCMFETSNSSDLTAETGTYRWMAPEVIRHENYSHKADIYSFGVVLWEMIAKQQPFKGLTPVQAAFAVAQKNMRPALPTYTASKLGELVEHCWHQDPAMRPAFADILEVLPIVQASLKKKDYSQLGFLYVR